MSAPSQAELLQKVFNKLKNSSQITSVTGSRIYNHVPQETSYLTQKPYLKFTLVSSNDWGPKNELGYESEIQIDIWSDKRGDEQCLVISDMLVQEFHNSSFVLASGQAILMQHVGSTSFTDPDGITHHGVVRIRVVTSES